MRLDQFKAMNSFRRNPIDYLEAQTASGQDRSLISVLGTRIHSFYSAESAYRILVQQSRIYGRCAMVFDKIEPLTGKKGIVQLQGAEWRDTRSQHARLFTESGLEHCKSMVENTANAAVADFPKNDSLPFARDIIPWVNEFVITNALNLFGGAQAERGKELSDDFLELNRLCGKRMLSPITIPSLRIRSLQKRLIRHVSPMLNSSPLIVNGRNISHTLDQIRTYLFAGHETTASSIVSLIYLLATHPEIQAQYRGLSAESKSAYLERAYNEALRLYPPAWILARTATADDPLLQVRKGDHTIIAVREIHRSARYWAKPQLFDPNRHEYDSLIPGQFIPFGAGPKICIGKRVAILEATSLVKSLLEKFELVCSSPLKMQANITLFPASPVIVSFRRLSNTTVTGESRHVLCN